MNLFLCLVVQSTLRNYCGKSVNSSSAHGDHAVSSHADSMGWSGRCASLHLRLVKSTFPSRPARPKRAPDSLAVRWLPPRPFRMSVLSLAMMVNVWVTCVFENPHVDDLVHVLWPSLWLVMFVWLVLCGGRVGCDFPYVCIQWLMTFHGLTWILHKTRKWY